MPFVVAVIVLVGIAVGAIALSGNSGEAAPREQPAAPPASPVEERSPPPRYVPAPPPGKEPDRPAPKLSSEVLGQVDALYEEAKAACNRAERERRKNDQDKSRFFAEFAVAKQKLEAAFTLLEPVTDWEEEATLEDWRIPKHVERVLRVFGKLSKLDSRRHVLSKGMK